MLDSRLKLFRNFCQVVWKHLGLPPLTERQKEICDWLQFGPKRAQVWAFRGIGKSWLCSAYVLWRLLLNHEEKILVISASKERSDQFVKFTRRLIDEMPLLQHLKPDRTAGHRDSSVSFDVGVCKADHAPSVKAAGITGQITGSRASLIVLDDVEVPNNSDTPTNREKLLKAVNDIDNIVKPDDPAMGVYSQTRVLGTPQSMETIYLKMIEKGYEPRIWPAQVPDADMATSYHGRLAPKIQEMIDQGEPAGTPTEPKRFGVDDLKERRLSLGALDFTLQFMLSTALTDAEKYPLKTKDLIVAPFETTKARQIYVHSNHPTSKLRDLENVGMHGDGFYAPAETVGEWVDFADTVVFVDPSGRGQDETAVVTASVVNGYLFVHRVFGMVSGYSDETLEAIATEARRVKATKVVAESNYGDGMFSSLLRPVLQRIYPCTVEEIKVTGQKETRIIQTLSPAFESHRVVFHESVPPADRLAHTDEAEGRALKRQLFYQLTHITHERGCLGHDDRLDALALCVSHFKDSLGLDSARELRERQHEKDIEDWVGRSQKEALEPNWLDSCKPLI